MDSQQDTTRPSSPRAKLERAIELAKAGQHAQAAQLLRGIVALQPVNQAAWLWLSAVAAERAEAESALAQAKKINPAHPSLKRAEQWVVHRFSDTATTKQSRVSAKTAPAEAVKEQKNLFGLFNSMALLLVTVAVLVGLLVLLLGVMLEVRASTQPEVNEPAGPTQPNATLLAQLELARQNHNWLHQIAILEALAQSDPSHPELQSQLAQAHLQQGLNLRKRGFVEDALAQFAAALEVNPGLAAATEERRLAQTYLAGVKEYQLGQWQTAATYLETVWAKDPDYTNVRDLLYSAYYNLALASQAARELPPARQAVQRAVSLRPDLAEPHRLLAEIEFAAAPQTEASVEQQPVPVEDRSIIVGIAEQRMLVFEGDEQVFDFVVSTGEPGRDTAIGEFEIQNKIDMAYASTWNLDMPYWMGIYWAGPLQNGIHSLPIVKHTGTKLWDGYLGQRVSYGCVILGDEDAATLYDWAEVGTKVKIVPSLANWLPEG